MYSRKTLEQVRDIVQDMGVTHYVLENSWCVRKTRDGCQMPEIFDIEEPQLAVSNYDDEMICRIVVELRLI